MEVTGNGSTVTSVVAVDEHPLALVPVTSNRVEEVGDATGLLEVALVSTLALLRRL